MKILMEKNSIISRYKSDDINSLLALTMRFKNEVIISLNQQ